ncbi:hypothetical protein HZH66_003424 [Vespula vulgaris]|uniref:Uncharacterized protein n=1 Tax=Vespula vulgaris TaxID=7454 RepID=A0A834KD42_VESVU|nr:hypothetical protein HZH66_003424 [Vespula vulgaris]
MDPGDPREREEDAYAGYLRVRYLREPAGLSVRPGYLTTLSSKCLRFSNDVAVAVAVAVAVDGVGVGVSSNDEHQPPWACFVVTSMVKTTTMTKRTLTMFREF